MKMSMRLLKVQTSSALVAGVLTLAVAPAEGLKQQIFNFNMHLVLDQVSSPVLTQVSSHSFSFYSQTDLLCIRTHTHVSLFHLLD